MVSATHGRHAEPRDLEVVRLPALNHHHAAGQPGRVTGDLHGASHQPLNGECLPHLTWQQWWKYQTSFTYLFILYICNTIQYPSHPQDTAPSLLQSCPGPRHGPLRQWWRLVSMCPRGRILAWVNDMNYKQNVQHKEFNTCKFPCPLHHQPWS